MFMKQTWLFKLAQYGAFTGQPFYVKNKNINISLLSLYNINMFI